MDNSERAIARRSGPYHLSMTRLEALATSSYETDQEPRDDSNVGHWEEIVFHRKLSLVGACQVHKRD